MRNRGEGAIKRDDNLCRILICDVFYGVNIVLCKLYVKVVIKRVGFAAARFEFKGHWT